MTTALAPRNDLLPAPRRAPAPAPVGWGGAGALVLPPLGNLEAYISAVQRLPLLTPEEEFDYAQRLRQHNDLEAAGRLVMSHLRLVVSVARQYLGYGLPHADLIQEGNVGLMKAVKRFDPQQGVRLVSYALHWIKAEIHDYILKNWRMVRVATTKAQRKLFFNLRSMKRALAAEADCDPDGSPISARREHLSAHEIDVVARELKVRREDVIEMQARLGGGDVALEPGHSSDDSDGNPGPLAWLAADAEHEPSVALEREQRERLASSGLAQALEQLDARARRIVSERWLKLADDGSGGMTLHQLAAEFGVSAERIRQIEVAALKKMRLLLQAPAQA